MIAAVVTPPDVTSQLLLAIPMCLLFELGILLARFVVKPVAAAGDPPPPTGDELAQEPGNSETK